MPLFILLIYILFGWILVYTPIIMNSRVLVKKQ
jgi:hypothetical protein